MRGDYTAICSTFLLSAGTSLFEKRRFRSNYTIFSGGELDDACIYNAVHVLFQV